MNRLLVIFGACALVSVSQADVWSNWSAPGTTIHYGGTIFNVTATGSSDVQLTGKFNLNLDVNLANTSDTTEQVAVYYRTGSYLGHIAEDGSNFGDWTLYGTGIANVAGDGNKSSLDLGSSLLLSQGTTYGFAIFALDGGATGIGYRSGTGAITSAPQNNFADSYLTISAGVAKGFGAASNPFAVHNASSNQRVFIGEMEYQPVPEPATLAALGMGALALIRRRRNASK